ncbi:MAG: hypothetical protein J6A59_15995 [Lachnospiraceae bacterium]|nr:hypothetical protein [Lachnospiraceae bacterium]
MSYSSSGDGIMALVIVLISFIVFFVVFGIIWFASYYPIYKLAKNRGVKNPWLAFVPMGSNYILGKIANRDMKVMNIYRVGRDTLPLFMVLLPLIVSVASSILMVIPILGWIASLGVCVLTWITMVTFYRLVLEEYYDNSTSLTLGIFSLLTGGVVFIVTMYIVKNKQPIYTPVVEPGNGPGYGSGFALLLGKGAQSRQFNGYGQQMNNMNNGYGQYQQQMNQGYGQQMNQGYGQGGYTHHQQMNSGYGQPMNQGHPQQRDHHTYPYQGNPEVNITKRRPSNVQRPTNGNMQRQNYTMNNGEDTAYQNRQRDNNGYN